MKHNPGFLALVDEARANVSEVEIGAAILELRSDAAILIDVREDHEWSKGRLPNAVHLGKGIIERDIESRFPDMEQKLILYCGGGYRSALACDALSKMGYKNVYSMIGGYKGWIAAGHAIETYEGEQNDTK